MKNLLKITMTFVIMTGSAGALEENFDNPSPHTGWLNYVKAVPTYIVNAGWYEYYLFRPIYSVKNGEVSLWKILTDKTERGTALRKRVIGVPAGVFTFFGIKATLGKKLGEKAEAYVHNSSRLSGVISPKNAGRLVNWASSLVAAVVVGKLTTGIAEWRIRGKNPWRS